MKPLSPSDRRHIAVLVHRSIRNKSQLLPQRSARIGICAEIEQHAGKRRILLTPAQIRAVHYAAEQWSMSAKALRIDFGRAGITGQLRISHSFYSVGERLLV
jgi:hypothetical protein